VKPNPGASDPAGIARVETARNDAPNSNDEQLLAVLPTAKVSLQQGIALAEQRSGVAISAKFEIEDGKFSLSVYTAKKGIEPAPEHNVLAELSGDPRLPEWQPQEEIFSDAPHIERASMHLTALQRSRTKLSGVIAKALAQQPGEPYSVTPELVGTKPKYHIAIATGGGKSTVIDVEGP
jgi:hypothetical protein